MYYPTLEEVNQASYEQICRWVRYLESPGSRAIGISNFRAVLNSEGKILDRICKRLEEYGGFTSEISKII